MRKLLALILALVLLSAAGMAFAISDLSARHDQVELRETILFGDRAAANGLTVHVGANLQHMLHWDTTTVFADGYAADTAFTFTPEHEYDEYPPTYQGLTLHVSINGHYDPDTTGPVTGLDQAYKELFESTPPGEEREANVLLSDYYDYYPISGWFDLPGYGYDWDFDHPSDVPHPGLKKAADAINDFLRIPILPDQVEHISIAKDANGNPTSYGGGNGNEGDSLSLYSPAVYTETDMFFSFDTTTNFGNIVDTSHIPGGYGIYRMPYAMAENEYGTDIEIGELSNAYPLDPNIWLLNLDLSHDDRSLLLHTLEGPERSDYYLTVIDIATMTERQKLHLGTDSGSFSIEENCIVYWLDSWERLLVLEKQEDGSYAEVIDVPSPLRQDGPMAHCFPSDAVFSYDGERLAVVGSHYVFVSSPNDHDEYWGWHEKTTGFYVAVFDESGLTFCADYESSLNLSDDATDRQPYLCESDRRPLSISW